MCYLSPIYGPCTGILWGARNATFGFWPYRLGPEQGTNSYVLELFALAETPEKNRHRSANLGYA